MWQQLMDGPQSEIATLLYLQSSFSQLLQVQVHFTVRVFPKSNHMTWAFIHPQTWTASNSWATRLESRFYRTFLDMLGQMHTTHIWQNKKHNDPCHAFLLYPNPWHIFFHRLVSLDTASFHEWRCTELVIGEKTRITQGDVTAARQKPKFQKHFVQQMTKWHLYFIPICICRILAEMLQNS
jgi:hypothetical protein